ncbi:DNA-binding response regulator [Marivirga lumbricoides]|uniref:DNA-binding response regulator n=1 Tax=Marivirga lumbricoides TaxID=1046115 RepID=A0ABQ1M304_9BACT|nr:DNA-binding response regulator [Marivirga lumbricoides]
MNLLIFEDEPLAQERIQAIVKDQLPDWKVAGSAQSLEEAKDLLNSSLEYDLLLCDIHLADGLCFELFKQGDFKKPIIFITAYDEYALESFEHNCIDYILKPIKEERLLKAFKKHESLIGSQQSISKDLVNTLISHYQKRNFKRRFLAKVGSKMIFIPVEDVACFFCEDKIVYMKEIGSSKKYVINHSLDELENQLLNPDKFYRINRSIIINLESVIEIKTYHNGRLKLELNAPENLEMVVARERVTEFKNWINQ